MGDEIPWDRELAEIRELCEACGAGWISLGASWNAS
jgi:hypothetical protein